MKLLSKKLSKKLIVTTGVGLGLGLAILGLGNNVSADEAPQTVNVGNSSKIISYASGHADRYGAHRVAVIQEAGTGQYLFCIEWSKRAPSNEQISKRYQANPSVQWLVNNFYSDHRFQSLGQGDEGDYWLYSPKNQGVIKRKPIRSRIGYIGTSLCGGDKNFCVITSKARYYSITLQN